MSENTKLFKSKKGGPHTKEEQGKRREEVYRLHFEYGYSARKIAEFLKINRGTINRDVMYWRSDIAKKWRHLEPTIYVINQVERLELQRTRLRKQLDEVKSFQEKITIEKFILNIDMKIANFQIKLIGARSGVEREITNRINEQNKKDKSKKRFISSNTLLEVSDKARKKIFKIYTEDMKF